MPRKKIVPKEEPLKKNIEDILGNTTSDDNNTIIKLPLTDSFLRENDDKKIDPVGYNSTNIDNFTEITSDIKLKSLCLWCRHSVNDFNCGMPISYNPKLNHYNLYGFFCSFECASAYNFSKNTKSDKVWDINNMINMLAKSYGFEIPIKPAPNYELLDIFMGTMTIDEFRSVHKNSDKFYTINIPPQSYVQNVAEILNTSYISNNKNNKNIIEKMI